MNDFHMLTAFFIFIGMSLNNTIWSLCIRRINQNHAIQAGLLSTLLTGINGFIIVSYTKNNWYLIPAVIGSFVGTTLAVHYDSKCQKRLSTNPNAT